MKKRELFNHPHVNIVIQFDTNRKLQNNNFHSDLCHFVLIAIFVVGLQESFPLTEGQLPLLYARIKVVGPPFAALLT